jgi:hypothetical protein
MAKVSSVFKLFGLLCVPSLFVLGCMPHKNYHPYVVYDDKTNTIACPLNSAEPSADDCCSQYSLQSYQKGDEEYLLGFVEFNEQGQLFDPKQIDRLMTTLDAESRDVIMLVYVHGWHHNASPEDENLKSFRRVLTKISQEEAAEAKSAKKRLVVGIYVGWRGDSFREPLGLINILSFSDRYNTATKLGHNGLIEVLARLNRFKKKKNHGEEHIGSTKLISIGHSLGGAALYSAIHPVLTDRFVDVGCLKSMGEDCDNNGYARVYGNLVLLINPAIEALRFAPLHHMTTAPTRTYPPNQLPVFATLAAENDNAVGTWFYFSRFFSTFFEKTLTTKRFNPASGIWEDVEEYDEAKSNTVGLGHFEPYNTDSLVMAEKCNILPKCKDSDEECTSKAWKGKNMEIPFPREKEKMCLIRNNQYDVHNPYLVIKVDKAIINEHNDLESPRLLDFVTELVYLSLIEDKKPSANAQQNSPK